LLSLEGVEQVLTRAEAAKQYNLLADRIGDLVVLGDKDTVFGELVDVDMELLPDTYRTHGSIYEMEVPLIVHNFQGVIPSADKFSFNLHISRNLLAPMWPERANKAVANQ